MRPYKYTDQEEHFCLEYITDLDPVRAWSVAYKQQWDSDKIPMRTKRNKAMKKIGSVKIQARIKELMDQRSQRLQLTADGVLTKIVEVVDRCMQNVPVFDDDGNPIGEYQFREAGALRGLELLAKHFGLLTEKYEFTNPVLEMLKKKLEAASPEDLRKFIKNVRNADGLGQRIEPARNRIAGQ